MLGFVQYIFVVVAKPLLAQTSFIICMHNAEALEAAIHTHRHYETMAMVKIKDNEQDSDEWVNQRWVIWTFYHRFNIAQDRFMDLQSSIASFAQLFCAALSPCF